MNESMMELTPGQYFGRPLMEQSLDLIQNRWDRLSPHRFGVMRSGLNARLIGPTDEATVRNEIIA